MSELPESWLGASLKEIAEIMMGQSPPSTTYNTNGAGLPFFQGKAEFGKLYPTVEKWCSEPVRVARKDDILITVRAPVGPTNLAPSECCIGRGLSAIRGKGQIDTKYLLYFFRSIERWLGQQGTGSTFTAINRDFLEDLIVPLAPLNEQKRIVAKLDELLPKVEACKERLQKIPAILKRFRQSVLAAAVSGKLTEEWRRQRGIEDDDTLPGGWSVVQLRDVVEKFNYGSSAKSDKVGSIPVLRMGNIQNGEIDWADLVYSNDENEINKYSLTKNTVLFNRTNSPELVGKTAIYRGDRPAIFAGYLIRLICGPRLNPEFLNLYLNSPLARTWCREVKSDGVSQSNINAQKLADFEIYLPPFDEQEEIVQQVNHQLLKVDKTLSGAAKSLKYVNRTVDAILSKAFAGTLVSQDPTDEPASVLLERIKSASNHQSNGSKPKRTKRSKDASLSASA